MPEAVRALFICSTRPGDRGICPLSSDVAAIDPSLLMASFSSLLDDGAGGQSQISTSPVRIDVARAPSFSSLHSGILSTTDRIVGSIQQDILA